MTVPRFWREQRHRYRLIGSECAPCHSVYFPPRTVCPQCRRESVGQMTPRKLSGRGTILAHTVVYQAGDGFDRQVPYAMALVELEEKCRLMTQVVDLDPAEVHSGLAVEACFRKIREDGRSGVIYYGYKFRPVRAQRSGPTEVVVEAKPRRRST